MRTESQVSSQSCCGVDVDARCRWARKCVQSFQTGPFTLPLKLLSLHPYLKLSYLHLFQEYSLGWLNIKFYLQYTSIALKFCDTSAKHIYKSNWSHHQSFWSIWKIYWIGIIVFFHRHSSLKYLNCVFCSDPSVWNKTSKVCKLFSRRNCNFEWRMVRNKWFFSLPEDR